MATDMNYIRLTTAATAVCTVVGFDDVAAKIVRVVFVDVCQIVQIAD